MSGTKNWVIQFLNDLHNDKFSEEEIEVWRHNYNPIDQQCDEIISEPVMNQNIPDDEGEYLEWMDATDLKIKSLKENI